MQKKYLDILLKNKYILINKDHWITEDYYSFTWDSKSYFVDKEIANYLEYYYTIQLNLHLFYGQNTFKTNIQERLKFITNTRKSKLQFYCNEIVKLNESLVKNVGEINSDNSPNQIAWNWLPYLLKIDPINILYSFLFKAPKKDRSGFFLHLEEISLKIKSIIEPSEMTEIVFLLLKKFPALDYLDRYFNSEDIQKIYAFLITERNINFLNNLIADLKKPTEKTNARLEISDNEIISNIQTEINVFCKGMPIEFAREYFKKAFVDILNKNKEPFLSSEQLENFIVRAFLGNKKIPKIDFNYGKGEKHIIVKNFHTFYTNAIKEEKETRPSWRDNYIELLSENFNDFPFKKVKVNFSKS